jgi:CheY-like chemotaxis protein
MSDSNLEKVLIIDDNSDYRKLIKTFIDKLLPGVETIEYDPVFEGIPDDNFNWSEIDVLLLDYHLSIVGTTGLDILHQHHKKSSFPATIMLTGAGTEEIAIRALKSGIYEYQPKQSLTKDKLKQSIIHAWEDKKSERKKQLERTQHNRSFSKEVFYENLEKNGTERALVIIRPDDIGQFEAEIGIIGRDNLVNHIAKNSFEVFKLGACNPNITRISDTEIGVQIDYPINQETLEFNMQGLSKHLSKCTFKFAEEKYKFSVSIGVLKLGIFNEPAQQLINIASTACDYASKTEGNSYYIWKDTDIYSSSSEINDDIEIQTASEATEDKEKLEAELKAAEEAKEKAEAAIQAEQHAKRKLEEELKLAAEAKEKAEKELKLAAEAKENAEKEAKLLIEEEKQKKEEAKKEAEHKAQAELQAVQEAKEKADAQLKVEAEMRAEQEAQQRVEAEQKAEAEAKAKAEAEMRAEQEAQQRVEAEQKAEAEAKAKAEAEMRAEQEAKDKADAELKAINEEKAKVEAEMRAEQEAQQRIEAELKIEAETKAKLQAEAEMKAAKEEKEKLEAELKAIAEAKLQAEAEMKAAKEEKEKLEAELKAIAEAKEKQQATTEVTKETTSSVKTENNQEEQNKTEKKPETAEIPEKDKKESETDSKTTESSEILIQETEKQIEKLINEKRIIQTYQPVIAMFDDENEIKDIYKTGLQTVPGSDEFNEHLLDISVFSIPLQQTINEWILRQVFLRITESGTTKCQYLFLISVTESWFSDVTLFQWLQKILSQTKKYNPGKSIILDVPLDIYNKHQKRAEALINTLRKSHQFTIALSNIHAVENVLDYCTATSAKLLMLDIEQLNKLSETLAPGIDQDKKDDDEEAEKQNLLQYLKSKKIRIITSGIENSTFLTDAITAGTDYTLGSFVGETQDNLIESTTVESFELT